MTVTTTRKDDFEFIQGAPVHYDDCGAWLAPCGSAWLNASNDPSEVTCMECLSLLEQREEERLRKLQGQAARLYYQGHFD